MTMDRSVSDTAVAPTTLPSSVRQRILAYLGVLHPAAAFGARGGLIDVPISFFLKNKLHLTAHEIAASGLVAGDAALSLLRVRLRPRHLESVRHARSRLHAAVRRRQRGPLRRSSPSLPVTLPDAARCGRPADGVMFLFVASAQNGLTSTIGQQHVMSGQISAVWNIFALAPGDRRAARRRHAQRPAGRQATPTRPRACCSSSAPRSWPWSRSMRLWKPDERIRQRARPSTAPAAHPLDDLKRLVRALADLSGAADLAAVEFRARLGHAAAVSICRTRCTPPMRSGASGTRSSPRPSSRPSCCSACSAGSSR